MLPTISENTTISIRGAREHNLKNINVDIPKNQLVVITGVSGSGKSSLAFDTIFAEGQRRYIESLSVYARQYLGQLERPEVDHIIGLSPAIAVDQKSTSKSPRSTVGTITEIYDYLRLLYARVGQPHCPICGLPITQQTPQQIVDQILQLPNTTRVLILAPLVEQRRGTHTKTLEDARRAGFVRTRIDGVVLDLDEPIDLNKNIEHTIELVVDRLIIRYDQDVPLQSTEHPDRIRITDSVETALKASKGRVIVAVTDGPEYTFSEYFACPEHGALASGSIEPRSFSFNSPLGACQTCDGLGMIMEFDPDLVIPDRSRSLAEGAITPWHRTGKNARQYWSELIESVAQAYGFSSQLPVADLPTWAIEIILYGSGEETKPLRHRVGGKVRVVQSVFEGVIPQLKRRLREAEEPNQHDVLQAYMTQRECPVCQGTRLRPESLAVTLDQNNIAQVAAMPITQALEWTKHIQQSIFQSQRERIITETIMREVEQRLSFLHNVGLHYLTLDRRAETLSGGEAQRIRLATQIGAGLSGIVYVLDEPSIGLHPRDNDLLLSTLFNLKELGNSVLIVEHDAATINAAEWIIDIGPGAGENGGEVVAVGTQADIIAEPRSITGQYLSGERTIPVRTPKRDITGPALIIRGAQEHNLRNIDVRFPLGCLTVVTGVSGSGKSTLVNDILYASLAAQLHRAYTNPGSHDRIEGVEYIDKVIAVDQSPLGRSGRSNPATYTGIFDPLRQLFASTPEARARGYTAGRFSFNVKGGRCEACRGEGTMRIEMQFLPDLYIPCDECHGSRYNRETLDIRYRGYTIAEVLALTIKGAAHVFENIPAIARRLQTLLQVGLGYITLGQPAPTLSGGEAQRIKLATELARRSTGKTVYILDEPTTGLHWADIEQVLEVLHQLVETGNTVVIIEHNLDVVRNADWIIDLGPGGGTDGGRLVVAGPPEVVRATPESWTGQFL